MRKYAVPKNTTDPGKVNIDFTPKGASPTRLVHVKDAAQCDPVIGGWYYDDPQRPTRLVVCSQTCERFKKDAGGQVDVVLGCTTVVR